ALYVTATENLDLLALLDQAAGSQLGHSDGSSPRECRRDVTHVDRLVFHPGRILETTQLRQPDVQRNLTTLEAGRYLLALHTAARVLGFTRFAAPDPGLRGLGTGSRTQMVNLDTHLSHLLDRHEVTHLVHEATHIRGVLTHDRLPHLAPPQR